MWYCQSLLFFLLQCTDNDGTTWTYNQGVILSGVALLAQASHSSAQLSRRLVNRYTVQEVSNTTAVTMLKYADAIATSVFERLVDANQVLMELCEPNNNCDGDQVRLHTHGPEPRKMHCACVQAF